MADTDKPSDDEDLLSNVDLLNESREGLLDTAAQQLRLLHELKRSHKTAARKSGGLIPSPPVASDATADLLFDLARLSVLGYSNLMKITNRHLDGIIDQFRDMTGTQAGEPTTPPRIVLEISGAAGAIANTKPFCVENPFRVPVDISFSDPAFASASDWDAKPAARFHTSMVYKRDGDGEPVRPGQGITLASGDQVELYAEITLSADHFHSRERYLGEAYVLSQGRVSGLLRFKVSVQ